LGGREQVTKTFDVLVDGNSVGWIPAKNGEIPQNAVVGGKTANGEALYIGRAHHKRSLLPGYVQRLEGCVVTTSSWWTFFKSLLCMSKHNPVKTKKEYEVLVMMDQIDIEKDIARKSMSISSS
jgi:hypothetical protein